MVHTPLQHQLYYIITAPVDSTITAGVLASTLHSLLAPAPPTLLLSTTTLLHTLHSTLHSQFR